MTTEADGGIWIPGRALLIQQGDKVTVTRDDFSEAELVPPLTGKPIIMPTGEACTDCRAEWVGLNHWGHVSFTPCGKHLGMLMGPNPPSIGYTVQRGDA